MKTKQEIIDPIMDVFSGSDGGIAFAKLYHAYLPQWLEEESTNPQAKMVLDDLRRLSKLCKLMMK